MSLKTNIFLADDNDEQFVTPQSFTTNSFHSGGNSCTTWHDLIFKGQDGTNKQSFLAFAIKKLLLPQVTVRWKLSYSKKQHKIIDLAADTHESETTKTMKNSRHFPLKKFWVMFKTHNTALHFFGRLKGS